MRLLVSWLEGGLMWEGLGKIEKIGFGRENGRFFSGNGGF